MDGKRTDETLAFDHAVAYYDETRGLSAEASRATIDLLSSEFAPGDRLLDVGAGTGLLAIPLAARGYRVDGVDLSLLMLERAREKGDANDPLRLVSADASRLPFRSGAYDGAFMRHLLHLIPRWRDALREVVRVVRPGGTLLVSTSDYTGLYREVQRRFLAEAGGLPEAIGIRPDDHRSLHRAMSALGAHHRRLPLVRGRRTLTIRRFIEHIEDGLYTWTWAADPEQRVHAARRIRLWLVRHHEDLDRPVEPSYAITWWAYDLPPRDRKRRIRPA
jgi:ubiquinone/menaquinone biosynthesis C-methylase UbiE